MCTGLYLNTKDFLSTFNVGYMVLYIPNICICLEISKGFSMPPSHGKGIGKGCGINFTPTTLHLVKSF